MIYCPGAQRWVALGAYVKAVKAAKANPTRQYKHGLTCWWSCTGADIMEQFRAGMHERISAGVPYWRRHHHRST